MASSPIFDSRGFEACQSTKKPKIQVANEIQKKIFESYTYIEELKKSGPLALEILRKHPDEYMIRYRYAHLLYQKKQYVEAMLQFQILIKQLPCNAFLYLSLGQVLEDMGCIHSAFVAYRTAFILNHNLRTKRAYARILSKCGSYHDALSLSHENSADTLVPCLSRAEVALNTANSKRAACLYRKILCQYPYNQEALWGLLKSSSYTHNSNDAGLSYTRYQTVWFDDPLQNQLVNYYRPPELSLPAEYYHDSTTFRRFSIGLGYSQYLFDNIRGYAKTYYTQFETEHFTTINRESLLLGFNKQFNKRFEGRVEVVGNTYDHLQHTPLANNQPLYSKSVLNYHLHFIYHKLPLFTVDIGHDYYDVIDTIPPFNNPVYNYSNQIGATSLNIRTADWDLFLYYNNEKIYWSANFVYGNYSDGNVKLSRSIRTGYRFCNLPSSSIYYNYFYLNFRNPAPLFTQNGYSANAYYDPQNFEMHTIGIDSKYDITEALQIGGELALIFIPKCNNFGYSGFGYFKYLFSDHWSCRLDLRYYYQNQGISRTGITGYYYAENASLQVNYEF